jgi:hypothetical protein
MFHAPLVPHLCSSVDLFAVPKSGLTETTNIKTGENFKAFVLEPDTGECEQRLSPIVDSSDCRSETKIGLYRRFPGMLINGAVNAASSISAERPRVLLADDHPAMLVRGRRAGRRMFSSSVQWAMDAHSSLRRSGYILMSSWRNN